MTAPTHQLIDAYPSIGQTSINRHAWQRRVTLAIPHTELPYEEARAHVELTQRVCCVVRESARGPRGGRGKMHYNATPAWPGEWRPNKFNRYFVVLGVGNRREAP